MLDGFWLNFILWIISWIAKSIVDLGVKKSKLTANTVDDIIFNILSNFFIILRNITNQKIFKR